MRYILALLVAFALVGVATAQTTTDPNAGDGVNDPDAFGDPADDGPSVGAPGDQQNVPSDSGSPDTVGDAADDGPGTPGDQGMSNAVWIALGVIALAVAGIAYAMTRRRHVRDDAVRRP